VSYDPLTQRCGENDVVEYKCGNSYYNPETHFCQAGTDEVQPLCGGAGGLEYTSAQRCENDVVESKCGDDWYNPLTQFCQAGTDNVEDLCGTAIFNSTQRCENGVVEAQCTNGTWYNTATQSCQNNVVLTKCGNAWYDPLLKNGGPNDWYNTSQQFCINNIVVTKGTFTFYHTADRKNYTYKWIKIGNGATWLAENLKGTTCPDGVAANCTTYGGLHSWATAVGVSSNCTYESTAMTLVCGHDRIRNPQNKIQGACPPDWHLPRSTEWNALITSVGSSAGAHLKAKTLWQNGNSNNLDTYGFSALPGGRRTCTYWNNTGHEINCENAKYEGITQIGYYWTPDMGTNPNSPAYQFTYSSGSITNSSISRYHLLSIRCVKD